MIMTYGGVEIKYDEKDNRWKFELRGRERSSESLAKAKEAVDAPEPKDKKDKFNRVAAFRFGFYNDNAIVGEVTSLAEKRSSYSRQEVWFVTGTSRSKESGSKVYPSTVENNALLAEWVVLKQQNTEILEKMSATVAKMTTVLDQIGVKENE